MDTLEIQLERVQTAIAAIETGAQKYEINKRSITKADLATLYSRETQLKAAIAAQDGDNILYANTERR